MLKTKQLSKKYGGFNAVNSVNMSIEKGDIYGFIGKNGAGKTTLIRMILGLVKPTSGMISIFGKSDETSLLEARKQIGAVIEYPALYPYMTAKQNLDHHRLLLGISDKSCVPKSLELANLHETTNKRVKDFSLGMKQRLGLAMALLNNPKLIILDEPTNGLDPNGIIELRNSIKRLADEKGLAIMISSHMLSELSQIATRYGFIDKGNLLKELTAEELTNECKQGLLLSVDEPEKAVRLLNEVLGITKIDILSNTEINLLDYSHKPCVINELLGCVL